MWTIGYTDDTASAGIWERAIPNPTYDDSGNILQPDFDHTPQGQYCYVTGNNVSNNSSEFLKYITWVTSLLFSGNIIIIYHINNSIPFE